MSRDVGMSTNVSAVEIKDAGRRCSYRLPFVDVRPYLHCRCAMFHPHRSAFLRVSYVKSRSVVGVIGRVHAVSVERSARARQPGDTDQAASPHPAVPARDHRRQRSDDTSDSPEKQWGYGVPHLYSGRAVRRSARDCLRLHPGRGQESARPYIQVLRQGFGRRVGEEARASQSQSTGDE